MILKITDHDKKKKYLNNLLLNVLLGMGAHQNLLIHARHFLK